MVKTELNSLLTQHRNAAWSVVASPNPRGFAKGGFAGIREATGGDGSKIFTWKFLDLPNGRYSVAVTWVKKWDRATNVKYKVAHDFGTLSTSETINQKVAPQADFKDAPAPFVLCNEIQDTYETIP